MTDTTREALKADKRNKAERLLNAAMDHLAETLEQPSDKRAWAHLLIYCPKELVEERMEAIREPGAASVEAALAYADGYKEALDDCERADVGELIEQVAALEGKLSFERALRSDAERKYNFQAAHSAELEDKLRAALQQPEAGKPVAYRWRVKGATNWVYDPDTDWLERHEHDTTVDIEPLFTKAPPASADLREALEQTIAAFEEIRMLLIEKFEEPARSAFWKAVSGRNKAQASLANARGTESEGGAKITQAEIVGMFGDTMPIEAAAILQLDIAPDEARVRLRKLIPSDPAPPDREAVKLINERLADLTEANALYGKDQRLSAPDKIARNDREIAWLKDLRSILALTSGRR